MNVDDAGASSACEPPTPDPDVTLSTSNGGAFSVPRLRYLSRLLWAWRFALIAALGIGVVRLLVMDWRPGFFGALVGVALGFAVLGFWSARRAAMRVLGVFDHGADYVAVLLVPASFGLWRLSGGRGRGGAVQEWVLVVRDDAAWLGRGNSVSQVRWVGVDATLVHLSDRPPVLRLSGRESAIDVRVHWPKRCPGPAA
jgi:hypothetical protein